LIATLSNYIYLVVKCKNAATFLYCIAKTVVGTEMLLITKH